MIRRPPTSPLSPSTPLFRSRPFVDPPRPNSLFPPPSNAADDAPPPVDDAGDLALPLMLERGRTYDEHALDAEVVGHDLGHRDGLDGFPQPMSSPMRQRPARVAKSAASRW